MKIFYTDGACSGNPGPGGWAVIAVENKRITNEWGGFENNTTNNRMELRAAIEALKSLRPLESATILVDSTYVMKGITLWIKKWKEKEWKSSKKKPVKNQDLWKLLDNINHPEIQWKFIPGHSGYEMNERCDRLAKSFIKQFQKQ